MTARSAWLTDADRGLGCSPGSSPRRCAAQPPTLRDGGDGPSPGATRSASPPSTVSPAIERFMRRSGRDLPSTARPRLPMTARGPHGRHPSPRAAVDATRPAARPGEGRAIRARPPALPSGAPTSPAPPQLGGTTDCARPSPLATRVNLGPAPTEPHRPPLPDQPGDGPAARRRPAADRRRRAGQRLGRRGRPPAGPGPLGPRRSTSPPTISATTAAARTSTRAS